MYLYDETGAPLGYRYRTPSYASGVFDGYFFEKNLQGDIVAVYNQSGTKVAGYTYDAWGKVTATYYNGGSTTAAQYNPFRYRGYYYDTETGLYYLQSRYYDPAMGRFINADAYISTGHDLLGYNMFAYCNNNPINYIDPNGYIAVFDDLAYIGIAIVAVCAAVILSDDTVSTSFVEGITDLMNSSSARTSRVFDNRGTVAKMTPTSISAPMSAIEYTDSIGSITYEASHRKRRGSKKKTNDTHTRKRAGSYKDKAKNKPNWNYRGNKKGPIDYTPIIIFDLQIILNSDNDNMEVEIWKPIS